MLDKARLWLARKTRRPLIVTMDTERLELLPGDGLELSHGPLTVILIRAQDGSLQVRATASSRGALG